MSKVKDAFQEEIDDGFIGEQVLSEEHQDYIDSLCKKLKPSYVTHQEEAEQSTILSDVFGLERPPF